MDPTNSLPPVSPQNYQGPLPVGGGYQQGPFVQPGPFDPPAEPIATGPTRIVNAGLGLGRIVLYRVSQFDVDRIHSQRGSRSTRAAIPYQALDGTFYDPAHGTYSDKPPAFPAPIKANPAGVVNNNFHAETFAGDVYPMILTRVNTDDGAVSGQVFLDGSDVLWVHGVFDAGVEVVNGGYNWPLKV